MDIRTLEGIDYKDILNVFNESFSDYFVPFKLSEEQLISKINTDNTDLELSVGVFDNQRLVAFILHGIEIINNQNVAYNGATGVIPQKRGSGLTKQMYLFILPILEKRGVDKIILEVITKNTQAIKSYEKSGFKTVRELACYKGEFNLDKTNEKLEIKELQTYQWKVMEFFWDINPTWQNSKRVMDELKAVNISFGAYIKGQLVGYVIYNPESKRIQQIATHKGFRKNKIASSLIIELKKKYGNGFSVINVDKKAENVAHFFDSIGFQNYLNQLEMELKINKNTKANNVYK